VQVFGRLWSPVDRSTPARAALEDQLDWSFRFYEGQREQRRWYGFWNYATWSTATTPTATNGNTMWRFAWDNSELSTDLWLWLYYLRTGGRMCSASPRR
jgi:hypothetical protein